MDVGETASRQPYPTVLRRDGTNFRHRQKRRARVVATPAKFAEAAVSPAEQCGEYSRGNGVSSDPVLSEGFQPVSGRSGMRQPRLYRGRFASVVLMLVSGLAVMAAATACTAGDCPPSPCDSPDAWVLSTRRLPGICQMPDTAVPTVQRYAGDERCWLSADLESLLAGTGPLVIFLHGNRYDAASAKQQGLALARRCRQVCGRDEPVRTLIYSWPSQQDGCLLKDGRAKYRRCYTEGRYLAWLLGQVPPERPVAIIGYSFGALITLEALEDLARAESEGHLGAPWRTRPGTTRLVFVAPAVRCDAFAPRGPYRDMLAGIESVNLIINTRDDALRFYHLLDPRLKVDALGYVGMPRRWMPAEVDFSMINAHRIIGRQHGLPLYLRSGTLMQTICRAAVDGLGEPCPPADGAVPPSVIIQTGTSQAAR